ncbi:MAG TPA: 3-dehydroquinate synthase [Lactovum miscens]|uniref:3-dehydroquinate synthase n=1 Tax=Lactovum miscens TaxID=190387 RepID=UPI002ED78DA8
MKIEINIANHPYEVLIESGAFKAVGNWVSSIWKVQKIVIISDETVASLYASSLMSNLVKAGFDVSLFTFPAGETSKNLNTAEAAWDFCAEIGLTRIDGIIGFGGGVAGDLAGFIASTYMRGIHFLQIATSLTSQVDSSVGGKTGINSVRAKNLIGTFSQPDGVLIDPVFLQTLNERCLHEGMGEVIKCALIADPELWSQLELISGSNESILKYAEYIIEHAIKVKRDAIIEDEHDYGSRLLLNFGHTIGHAIEAFASYGQVMHGEAVAIGMFQITKVAEEKGLAQSGLTEKIRQMLQKFILPVGYEPWEVDKLFEILTHDKKVRGSQFNLILVPKIGNAKIYPLEIEKIKDFLIT